jgi:sugar lactone lactonase YvrE
MNKTLLLPIFFICLSSFTNAQHAVSTLCGSSTQGNPLSGPNGICITSDGSFIYLADYSNHRIKKINTQTGMVTPFAGTGVAGFSDGSLTSAQFNYPSGIKLSSDNLFLYVCDNNNCLIRQIDINAQMVSTIAGQINAFSYSDNVDGLLAEFNQPTDLVISPGDSLLYISDAENHLIRKMNLLTGEVSTVAGIAGMFGNGDGNTSIARFHNPNGLALSEDGTSLYIADAGNNRIRKLDLLGSMVITIAGNGTAALTDNVNGLQASFNVPQGISILSGDSLLYVDDTYNNVIRNINLYTSAVTTIAGDTGTGSHFADNMNGMLARFYHPVNSVLSPDNSILYISDQENFRIRKMNTDITTTGIISYENFTVSLYPNPCRNLISVQLPHSRTTSDYKIINATGQPVQTVTGNPALNKIQIETNNFLPGIYFLCLFTDDGKSYMKKFIRQE